MNIEAMYELIESFPEQINFGLDLSERFEMCRGATPSAVLIAGMGGSGIGGRIVSQYLQSTCNLPILTVNDYSLPHWCDKNTLVILCSYSGNTEETISVMRYAIERECKIACVTSGGTIAELAETNNLPCINIPGGKPPRSQFALAYIQLLRLLELHGIINSSFKLDLKKASLVLLSEQAAIKSRCSKIAASIATRVPTLYADSSMEGIAARWRQQLNENAKMLCIHHQIPEMNHNELVGWGGADNRFAAIILKSDFDHPKTKIRMDISAKIMKKHSDQVHEIHAKGETALIQMFYLIHFGDWLSLYLANERGFDPVAIPEIELLKSELSKI